MGFFIPPKAPTAPPPPQVDDAAIEEARRKERLARLNRTGRASTILTSGRGAVDAPGLAKKQLLGE